MNIEVEDRSSGCGQNHVPEVRMSCIKTFPRLHQRPPGPVARLVAEQGRAGS